MVPMRSTSIFTTSWSLRNLLGVIVAPIPLRRLESRPNPRRISCVIPWSSRHDYSPSSQCCTVATVANDSPQVKNKVIRLAILHQLVPDPGAQSQILRVSHSMQGRYDGTDGRELVKGLGVIKVPAASLRPLPVPRRHIIADSVAQNITQRILVFCNVFGIPPHHEA